MFIIPTTPGLAHYTQATELDGREYRLRFEWTGRLSRWSFALLTEADVPLVEGILLVPNVPLLRKLADERRPPGILAVQSVDGLPPGLNDFHPGGRCRLVYYTQAELEAASG